MTWFPSNGDPTYRDEEPLKRKVLTGLGLAVDELRETTVFDRNTTKTEREKLVFCAVDEFDLNLTYGWYLAGTLTATPTPESSTQLPTPNTPDPEVERYRRFFAEDELFRVGGAGEEYTLVNVLLGTSKHQFLIDFYKEFAPEEYRELYIESTKIREELETMGEKLDSQGEDMSLGSFGVTTEVLSQSEISDLRRNISGLHIELTSEAFEDIRKPVIEGTDIIEMALKGAAGRESLTDDQERILLDLGDFYYDYVWKYPAHQIAANEASGPHAGEFKQRHSSKLDKFDQKLNEKRESIESKCLKANLLTGPNEYVSDEKAELADLIHSLVKDEVKP
ncbi:hypothetical protein [Halomarina ordinaria]|uniref:DUF8098 domain-containing protein n=1 Tax=Halomarina ordinaria TaxID=3033939 RepID=A0ABD5UCX4_9EURY|nr:hypothetical protein [Halomarina sp. PSRA2]